MTEPIDNNQDTCAGLPIAAAMHPFSVDFLAGCKKFSELASTTEDTQEVLIFSASCIVNAACYLEAKLNEEVAIARLCFDEGSVERETWDSIKKDERRLSVSKKWNRISAFTGGTQWDSGKEPFQAFETISSLRNELVHFKGELLGRDEAPSNKISALMERLGIRSEASWIEDDCSSWVTDLLSEKSLVDWVAERMTSFDDQYYALMQGRS